MGKSKQYKDVPPPKPAKNKNEEKKINEQLLKDLETEEPISEDNPSWMSEEDFEKEGE